MRPALYTRWSGPTHPTGHIDHICYSTDRELTLTSSNILDSSLWFGLTDHRPKQAAFTICGGSPDRGASVPEVVYPVDLNLKDKNQIAEFQNALSERWLKIHMVPPDATQADLATQLRVMSETLYAAAEAVVSTAKPH